MVAPKESFVKHVVVYQVVSFDAMYTICIIVIFIVQHVNLLKTAAHVYSNFH